MDVIRPVSVLVVEDNLADFRLMLEFLQCQDGKSMVAHVRDGVDALAYLRQEGQFAQTASRPDFILLDLNLPRMDGRRVLKEIKSDPKFNSIPVIVFSTSNAQSDILKCYELGASAYLKKPLDLDQFSLLMERLKAFWIDLVSYAKVEI